ncbi:MAG: glycosyltransferase family 2 protein [Chryseolinea sp.]
MEISIVIPLHNEEDNVKPLLDQISVALRDHDYEILLVDDGSSDTTVQQVKMYATHRVKLIVLNKNYGQTAAIAAGINEALGEFIVTMDGDLQNDPLDIPFMIEKIKTEDWDVIAGNRKDRKDGKLFRKLPSSLANRLIRKLTDVHIQDYGCTLKVFKSRVAKNLGLYGELHRFIPILAVLEGARLTEMDVRHHPRKFGKSKYGLNRTVKVMSDLLLMVFLKKYFQRPIHFFGPLGLICTAAGSLISFYLLILKIMGNDIWGRPLLILGVTLVLAGIQFLTFGIIAELVIRVYYESQHKTTYNIREVYQRKRETFELETAY